MQHGMISLTNTTTMMFAISRAVLFVTVASGGIIPRLTRLDIGTRAGLNDRSFSRDVIPFPVGHIGVPLSIA